jgi:hypothetical protein
VYKKVLPVILVVFMIASAMYAAKAEPMKVSGSLEKITVKTITIKDGTSNESKDFTLSQKTQYLVNNKSSKNITLKQGDKVTLEVDNKNVVLTVNVEGNS